MEHFPNELLEKVLSYVTDDESLWSCRRVSRCWNQVAIRFWRQIYSRRPTFLTDALIYEFLWEQANCRIQDFAFSRVGFKSVNHGNIDAVLTLLRECSHYIRDMDISTLHESLEAEDGKDFLSLLNCLDASVLPLLEELRIGAADLFPTINEIPNINLHNLRVLRLPLVITPLEGVPAMLVQSAPNLQLLETTLTARLRQLDPIDTWPFPEEYHRIRVIEVKMGLKFPSSSLLSLPNLSALTEKLEQWRNIQVTRLTLFASGTHFSLNEINMSFVHINRILQMHAEFIKVLKMNTGSGFGLFRNGRNSIRLPVMPMLESLEINFRKNLNPIGPIQGNPFSNLQSVTVHAFGQPTKVFSSAVLESVQNFTLYDTTNLCTSDNYTSFNSVFPNLVTFAYVFMQSENVKLNFEHLAFVLSTLRMDSLRNVNYVLGKLEDGRRGDPHGLSLSRRINDTFSGFHNLEQVVEDADVARDEGCDGAEEFYWDGMEQVRRPGLANMTGLKKFSLDFPVDDNFARGVLLQMKPLDLLTLPYSRALVNQRLFQSYSTAQVVLLHFGSSISRIHFLAEVFRFDFCVTLSKGRFPVKIYSH